MVLRAVKRQRRREGNEKNRGNSLKIHKGAVLLTQLTGHEKDIPGAVAGQIAGVPAIVFKHELYPTLLARNLGHDVPSPINYGWKYPGLYPPRENQLHTAAFGTLYQRAFILNEMRTGKTYSALWAAEYLLQQGFIKRVLVVCLKTTLHIVWEQAMFECLPHRRCSVLHGTREKRKDLLEQNAEFCIINHDGLMVFSEEVLRGKTVHVDCTGLKDKFDLIIFDEADVLCNHRTKMYKALKSLLTPDVWLWLMTGTPIPNEYADAWGLLSLVCKKLPVKSWTQFRELVMFRASQYKWLNRDGARQLLFDLMQPAIRFTQAQCFDLPAVQEIFRECELSDEQKRLYRQMQRAGRLERTQEESQVAAANAAVKVAKLLQISSGAVRDEFGSKIQIDSKPRIQALLSVLHELGVGNGEKQSAVFMPYKYIMEDVKDALEKKHLRCALVNGDTPDWKRREILKQFSSDFTGTREYEVLIAHPEVVAHGVDLTASESVIWYAPCFGPRFYQQGSQRHQGAKQKGRPVVVHLTATKLERERFAVLRRATQTQSDFLAMYENALSEEI